MRYVVMSRNNLEGFQKGYMEDLRALFYESAWLDEYNMMRHTWTPCLGLAKTFPNEEIAWEYMLAHWGLKFSYTNFMIVSVHQEAIDHSLAAKDKILYGKEAV